MDITATITALITAFDAFRSTVAALSATKIAKATADLYERILAVYAGSVSLMKEVEVLRAAKTELKERNTELEKRIAKLQAKLNERASYRLCKNDSGKFVYRFTPKGRTKDEPHDICPRCYDEGAIMIIQPLEGALPFYCPKCRMMY